MTLIRVYTKYVEDHSMVVEVASLMGEEGLECLRLVVVEGKDLGKSALTVRFLTKRFIGEYQESKGIDNYETINDNDDMTSHAVLQADVHIWVAGGRGGAGHGHQGETS